MLRSLCVFCGSSPGRRPEYAEAARFLGQLLAQEGIALVYGGANAGLMGVVADACLAGAGTVIGVIPQSLVAKEIAHQGLTRLHVVESMHQRKALMADLADAFVALPGGMGTFEEFFEMLTWSQLGLHRKACGLLNACGYYDHFLAMADHAVKEGFLRAEHRHMMLSGADPGSLLDALAQYQPPLVPKWIDREAR